MLVFCQSTNNNFIFSYIVFFVFTCHRPSSSSKAKLFDRAQSNLSEAFNVLYEYFFFVGQPSLTFSANFYSYIIWLFDAICLMFAIARQSRQSQNICFFYCLHGTDRYVEVNESNYHWNFALNALKWHWSITSNFWIVIESKMYWFSRSPSIFGKHIKNVYGMILGSSK